MIYTQAHPKHNKLINYVFSNEVDKWKCEMAQWNGIEYD